MDPYEWLEAGENPNVSPLCLETTQKRHLVSFQAQKSGNICLQQAV